MARKSSKKTARRQPSKTIVPQPAGQLARSSAAGLPRGYPALLEDIKSRIRTAQIKASLSVNREMIGLYWSIGRDIVARQHLEGWGAGVINRLAKDIRTAFLGIEGFSPSNISRMRAFHLAWADVPAISAQPVPNMQPPISAQPVPKIAESLPPSVLMEIPWGHNIALIFQLTDPVQRLWYARQTIENGWSRSMLEHWIDSGLYTRQGKSINNFKRTLPAPQSDLAQQLIKDPYKFDFFTLATDAAERELEQGLLAHIRKFLLELGAGFSFVGQQVRLEVDGEEFFIDLLFYHLRLRCYVVVDLKVEGFKPEFAGKMNFYLSAVDDQMRHADDKPSIGLILCKTRKKTIAEYALRDLAKPVGVARYVTRLIESLPEQLAGSLPSIEQIEAEFATESAGGKPANNARTPRRRRR